MITRRARCCQLFEQTLAVPGTGAVFLDAARPPLRSMQATTRPLPAAVQRQVLSPSQRCLRVLCLHLACTETRLPLRCFFFFFFALVTGPRRSLSHKLSDARVYEPQIRARLGTTAHFCEVVVLKSPSGALCSSSYPRMAPRRRRCTALSAIS